MSFTQTVKTQLVSGYCLVSIPVSPISVSANGGAQSSLVKELMGLRLQVRLGAKQHELDSHVILTFSLAC